jgi:cob(I)alamin adenosyltransferase
MGKKRLPLGMIQVYTGDGKGKTTAALGLACRAAGHGYKALIIQFIKGNIGQRATSGDYGELETARRLAPHLTIKPMGRGCRISRENPDPEDVKLCHEAMLYAQRVIAGGKYDIVILDEINVAVDLGLVGKEEVLRLLDERPSHVEVILTGRHAAAEIIERADLVTEMVEIKHYYRKGVESRTGIEK